MRVKSYNSISKNNGDHQRGSVRIYLSLRMKLDNKMRIISMLIDVPDMLTKQVSDG